MIVPIPNHQNIENKIYKTRKEMSKVGKDTPFSSVQARGFLRISKLLFDCKLIIVHK